MGRKQYRTWKYILLCTSSLIFASLLSCATLGEFRKKQINVNDIISMEILLKQGNFKEALNLNYNILANSDKALSGDRALYNIALIYAHKNNPDKDYKKSLFHLEKLINEFPKSILLEQAKIWTDVLNKIDNFEAKANILSSSQTLLKDGKFKISLKENQEILALSESNKLKDQALFNIAIIYAHYNNPDRDYRKSIHYLDEIVKKYQGSHLLEQAKVWIEILNIIEQAKQVDIEIEEMKKELRK